MSGGAKFKVEKIAPIRVIFEDAFIMAVDKPAFMTSEEVAEVKKLPLLHRLDRETSGVLLLTKDEAFRTKAVSAFKKREVKKEYIAIVEGRVVEAVEINAPILTIKKGNTAHSKISDDGKEAISHIEPLMMEGKRSKIKVSIDTGRTHQIRVHMAYIGHPVSGDKVYGVKNEKVDFEGQCLHARKIGFIHPKTNEYIEFTSELPDYFKKYLKKLENISSH